MIITIKGIRGENDFMTSDSFSMLFSAWPEGAAPDRLSSSVYTDGFPDGCRQDYVFCSIK